MKLTNLFKRLFERGLNWLANGRLDELAQLRDDFDRQSVALETARINELHMRALHALPHEYQWVPPRQK